jgi:hypothetical protein
MRWLTLAAATLIGIAVAIAVWTSVFRPSPAADRLAGVSVAVMGFTINELPGDRHQLNLTVNVTSPSDLDECLGFALDEPFAGRRVEPLGGTCTRPRAGTETVQLVFDRLGEDDLRFPSHTLVWGIPGGRCGPILEVFGVCVVEQAGTAAVELPPPPGVPSFPPFGTIGPLFSFPEFSFAP